MKNFSQRNRSEIIMPFTLIELLVAAPGVVLNRIAIQTKTRAHSIKFTLIELLVVIAIISILMALLLPALKKVRGIAKQIECLNTMKQCGTASVYYTNDFGYLPPVRLPDSPVNVYFYWCNGLISLGYLPPKSTILVNAIGATGLDGYARQYTCPEVPGTVGERTTRPSTVPDIVIAVNNGVGYNPSLLHGPNFKYPSRLCYIADSYKWITGRGGLRWGHNNSANVIYVDMHGDSRKPNSMSQSTDRTPFWLGENIWIQKSD